MSNNITISDVAEALGVLRPQARVEAQPPEAALSAETEAGSGPVR